MGENISDIPFEELERLYKDGEAYREKLERQASFMNFRPLEFQIPWYDACLNKTHQVVTLFAGNQVGKSTCGSTVTTSRCLGVWPEAISGNPLPQKWARDTLKGRRFLAAGETFEVSLRDTIVPKLQEFVTPDMLLGPPKRNNMGIPVIWRFVTGAELVLMSYQQAKDSFEGAVWDGVWFDEPPPEDVFNAVRRGCMAREGQILITATPLKEPWMLDNLILPARDPSSPTFGTVAEFQADIWWQRRVPGWSPPG